MSNDGFELITRERVDSLALTVERYRHARLGSAHIHLAAEDGNNAFLVALRTVPQDSTGVAHILEHVSLCGSEHYPVRDPFFMMMRRSLNTFMNAFTASDWTAYPFATQNRKDFDNLLRVYLDAVFFPRLDPLDFAQEGHRLEFDKPDDPTSPLVVRGVVYNEMKGAMSSPLAQVAQTLQSRLFPSTTYHFNSGGDPEVIPELDYEQLVAFHARHYHPSNAVFMTYGSFPAEEHQARFESQVLSRFEPLALEVDIPDEQRYAAPLETEGTYALDEGEDTARKTHVLLGWLLGKSSDIEEMLRAHVLAGVLLDHGASPLRRALETTDLGSSPSELCGLDDSTREATFVCGLEGSEPDRADAVQALALGVLEEVARDGVPPEQVEAVLHQVELGQREVGGGRFPYGLQLMTRALPAFLHGGDAVAVLNIDPALNKLRAEVGDPDFIKNLTRRMLLDNRHRVRLVMRPDASIDARRSRELARRLEERKSRLAETEKEAIIARAAALARRQEQEDDPELLPKVGLEDVPPDRAIAEGASGRVDSMDLTWYAQGTNGLVYEQLVVDLPAFSPELVDALPIFCDCIAEVGSAGRDYLETQSLHAAVTGGVHGRVSMRAGVENLDEITALFVLSGKSLARNQSALARLLKETLTAARFDELARLRELVAQMRAQDEAALTQRGHVLAMSAASAALGPWGMLMHRWNGLEGLRRLRALDDAIADEERLAAFAASLEELRGAIAEAPRRVLAVGESGADDEVRDSLDEAWRGERPNGARYASFACPWSANRVHQAWSVNTQVSFCARAYATVPESHPDAPALMVLGPFLTDGFLHRAIREQGGAYGGGAGYNADTGALRFFSYRDPRLGETLRDFDRAVAWLVERRHEPRRLEEAILRVLGEIDRPESPAGEAISAYFAAAHGRTPEHRRRLRRAVLEVTLEDLERVGRTYLVPEEAHTAVVSNETTLAANTDLELEICKL